MGIVSKKILVLFRHLYLSCSLEILIVFCSFSNALLHFNYHVLSETDFVEKYSSFRLRYVSALFHFTSFHSTDVNFV